MLKKMIRTLLMIIFWIYMFLLLYFLFFSEKYGRTVAYSEYQYNLQLFREINRYILYRDIIGPEYFVINLFGNLAAFIPFGFLVPVILREQRKKKTVIGHYFLYFWIVTGLGFLFSLSVETIQLITKVGCFDVDDLFLNTVGVIVGYFVYLIAKVFVGNCSKKSKGSRK